MISITIDGNNVTDYLVSYTREKDICSSEGIVELSLAAYRNINPYDLILAYEDGNLMGTFYVDFTERLSDGTMTIHGRDNSKRSRDYFVAESYTVEGDTTSRYWIEFFLGMAGIPYNFTTEDGGYTIQEGEVMGPAPCADIVDSLVRHSGWYYYFDNNNVTQIGKLQYDSTLYKEEFTDDDIITIVHNRNDQYLRNRAIIWGTGYRSDQTWVFADIGLQTPWNYDSLDRRAILAVAGFPIPHSQAVATANVLLNEYARLVEEKVVQVHGAYDLEVGDFIFIKSGYYNRVCLISNINVSISDNGIVTTFVLDRRCPRFVGFYDIGGIVYAGTEADGVWTKPLKGPHTWTNYSTGLTDLGVTDLDASYGVLACVTDDGSLWGRTVGDASWLHLQATSYVDSQTFTSYPATSGNFVACNINDVDQTIYGLYTLSGEDGWRTWVSKFPSVYGGATNLMVTTQSGNTDLRGYDIESTFDEIYISTADSGLDNLVFHDYYRTRDISDFKITTPITHTVFSGVYPSRPYSTSEEIFTSFNMGFQVLNIEDATVETIYTSVQRKLSVLINSSTALEIPRDAINLPWIRKIDLDTGVYTDLIQMLHNPAFEYIGNYVEANDVTGYPYHVYNSEIYIWFPGRNGSEFYFDVYNYTRNEIKTVYLGNSLKFELTYDISTPASTDSDPMFASSNKYLLLFGVSTSLGIKNFTIYNYNIATETVSVNYLAPEKELSVFMKIDADYLFMCGYYGISGGGTQRKVYGYDCVTNVAELLMEPTGWMNEYFEIKYDSKIMGLWPFRDKAVVAVGKAGWNIPTNIWQENIQYLEFYEFSATYPLGTLVSSRAWSVSYGAELFTGKKAFSRGDDYRDVIWYIVDAGNTLLSYNPWGGDEPTITNVFDGIGTWNGKMYFQYNKFMFFSGTNMANGMLKVIHCPGYLGNPTGVYESLILKYSNAAFTDLVDGSLPFTLDISNPNIITATIGVTNSGVLIINGEEHQIGTSIGQLFFSKTGLPGHFRSINLATMSGSYIYDTRTFTIVSGEYGSEDYRTCIGFVRMDSTLSSTGNFSYIDVSELDDLGATVIFPDVYMMQEFSNVPETLETSNYEHWATPYFLVGTRRISGEVFQRDIDELDFVERSTGLPDSKITILRLDDMI